MLTAYTAGMHLTLNADTSNTGAASLNVDSVGLKSIKQPDGLTDPTTGQIVAGRPIAAVFRWHRVEATGEFGRGHLRQPARASAAPEIASRRQPFWAAWRSLPKRPRSAPPIWLPLPWPGCIGWSQSRRLPRLQLPGSGCTLAVTIGYTDSAGATTNNTISGLSLAALGRSMGSDVADGGERGHNLFNNANGRNLQRRSVRAEHHRGEAPVGSIGQRMFEISQATLENLLSQQTQIIVAAINKKGDTIMSTQSTSITDIQNSWPP